MTDQTRRLLSTLQNRWVTRPQAPVVARPEARPIRLEIRLPGALAAAADELQASMQQQLPILLAELGLTAGAAIVVRDADPGGTATTASIDGRPVLQFESGDLRADTAAGPLLDAVLSRILRRLPLLAGPGTDPRSPAAYLMTLGCRAPAGTEAGAADVDAAERLVDARSGEHILIEVAESTMRRVDGSGAHAMVTLRETESRKWGVVYPDVRVVPTDERPGTVRLRLNDVTFPARHLGDDVGWSDVVRHTGRVLAGRRHWFLRMGDVDRVMDQDLTYVFPDLVAVADANYSRAQTTACLRELVRDGRRMRNIPRILWLMLDSGGSPAGSDVLRMSESPLLPKARHRPPAVRDPMVQAVRVRKLGIEDDWRLANYRGLPHAARLAAGVEERLLGKGGPGDLAAAEWAAVQAVAAAPGTQHVVTRSVEALGPVRDALQAVDAVPRVVASHELPPDADLAALPVLTAPGNRT